MNVCDRKPFHAGLCAQRCTRTFGCTERSGHRGKCTTGLWGPLAQGWADNGACCGRKLT